MKVILFLLFCIFVAASSYYQFPPYKNSQVFWQSPQSRVEIPAHEYYGYPPRYASRQPYPFQNFVGNQRYSYGGAGGQLEKQNQTPQTPTARRLNPFFESSKKHTNPKKSSFGEAIVPEDCKEQACCGTNEKWDAGSGACLKKVKVNFRRRSI